MWENTSSKHFLVGRDFQVRAIPFGLPLPSKIGLSPVFTPICNTVTPATVRKTHYPGNK
jgi:hypothetical protein